jgi:hypothetical protein
MHTPGPAGPPEPGQVLVVAVTGDGQTVVLNDITERVTAAAAAVRPGTCYAKNRRDERGAIHLALPGAHRALCGVLQGESAADAQVTCGQCQFRSWGAAMFTAAGTEYAQQAYDALASVFPPGSTQRADLDAGLNWWLAWKTARQPLTGGQRPGEH